jgi:hypothetical protein
MPLILGTNSIKDTGYDVANSLRVDTASNDYLERSISSAGSGQIWTASAWFKRSVLGQSASIYCSSKTDTTANFRCLFFNADDEVQCAFYDGGYTFRVETSALFRDQSAWYHIVTAVDTTQSTDTNRVKIYINGVLQTSFSNATYPSHNSTLNFSGTDIKQLVSSLRSGSSIHNSGYIAELHVLDGVAKQASDFGEYDSDTNIWIPKEYDGTYGTNGFYLDFENSSSLGADVSGNGNNFTVNNLTSADQTTDTCTNNFATLNPLGFAGTIPTFSQGNLNVSVGSSASLYSVSTIGVSSGKWYLEGELEAAAISGGLYFVDYGFHDRADSLGQSYYVSDGRMFWLSSWDGKINYRTGGSTTAGLVTGLATLTPGDFFQLYLDMDNKLMYWGKNGSLLNTTGVSFNGKESLTGEYFFAVGDQYTAATHEYAVNFGQGSIDGNAVSNFQDANGFGNFKYNPTVTTDEGSKDFLALCTKNLAEYG